MLKLIKIYHKLKFELRQRYWRRVAPGSSITGCYWGSKKERSHPKLCLFSTFDPKGRIDPYVKHYIRSLYECGFDVVVISTSPSICSEDLDEVKDFCRAVIHRKNIGLDFGSWKAATEYLPDWGEYESLLLTNDSVYGPFSNLQSLFEKMDSAEESVCGLTDNFEASYHIQSYFLYIKKSLLRSDVFQTFWQSIRLHLDKTIIINAYEVGFSQHLLHHGIKIRAMYPYYDIRDYVLALGGQYQYYNMILFQPVNPSIFMWSILLKNFGFPFLKTEIVKTNRLGFRDVVNWRSFLPEEAFEWRELIENHLKRVVPNARG